MARRSIGQERFGFAGRDRTPSSLDTLEALPDNPGEVFADSAYRGNHFRDAVRAKDGIPRIVAAATSRRRRASSMNGIAASHGHA